MRHEESVECRKQQWRLLLSYGKLLDPSPSSLLLWISFFSCLLFSFQDTGLQRVSYQCSLSSLSPHSQLLGSSKSRASCHITPCLLPFDLVFVLLAVCSVCSVCSLCSLQYILCSHCCLCREHRHLRSISGIRRQGSFLFHHCAQSHTTWLDR